jgi:hypothetical protein
VRKKFPGFMLFLPSELNALGLFAGGEVVEGACEDSVDKLLVEAAIRRGRADSPRLLLDMWRKRFPAIDCKSPNEFDSLTPVFGLRVALWNAFEMLHLRRE